jgi:hypothetical protein
MSTSAAQLIKNTLKFIFFLFSLLDEIDFLTQKNILFNAFSNQF